MKKQPEKMFVVRKYIMAKSASEAIKKDKITPVDGVWIDTDFQKKQFEQLAGAIGFDNGYFPE